MNALELADALDWVCENHLVGIGDADFKATATMLRQQQADLKDADKYALELERLYEDAKAEIEALKAHPVKELTDEEIWDWFKENTALTKESALMIARAILRKAQEK